MNKAIQSYVDNAVHVHVAPLRVGATLVTCELAVAVLNELRLPEEPESAYLYVNVHNPMHALYFDRDEGGWRCRSGLEQHPVWGVNWAAACRICGHMGGRLPLAHEWECFASNGDTTRVYPWGSAPPTYRLANYDEYFGGTSPVGSFAPSDAGLYDLAGNLGEWCADTYGTGEDTTAWPERVVKGGAWSKDARYLAIAVNRGKWGRLGTTTIGFRPVWDEPLSPGRAEDSGSPARTDKA